MLILAVPRIDHGIDIRLRTAQTNENRRVSLQLHQVIVLTTEQPAYRTVVGEDVVGAALVVRDRLANRNRCQEELAAIRVTHETFRWNRAIGMEP